MTSVLMLFAVLALMGNAIASKEQRADARAAVKRLQWIPMTGLGLVAAFIALVYAGAIPTH